MRIGEDRVRLGSGPCINRFEGERRSEPEVEPTGARNRRAATIRSTGQFLQWSL